MITRVGSMPACTTASRNCRAALSTQVRPRRFAALLSRGAADGQALAACDTHIPESPSNIAEMHGTGLFRESAIWQQRCAEICCDASSGLYTIFPPMRAHLSARDAELWNRRLRAKYGNLHPIGTLELSAYVERIMPFITLETGAAYKLDCGVCGRMNWEKMCMHLRADTRARNLSWGRKREWSLA